MTQHSPFDADLQVCLSYATELCVNLGVEVAPRLEDAMTCGILGKHTQRSYKKVCLAFLSPSLTYATVQTSANPSPVLVRNPFYHKASSIARDPKENEVKLQMQHCSYNHDWGLITRCVIAACANLVRCLIVK